MSRASTGKFWIGKMPYFAFRVFALTNFWLTKWSSKWSSKHFHNLLQTGKLLSNCSKLPPTSQKETPGNKLVNVSYILLCLTKHNDIRIKHSYNNMRTYLFLFLLVNLKTVPEEGRWWDHYYILSKLVKPSIQYFQALSYNVFSLHN